MPLGVYCECRKCVTVTESQAGSAVKCPCGRRVVVPLAEEFVDHPVLLSAATVERRIFRLVDEGILPRTDGCLRCSEVQASVLDIDLECEKASRQTTGGFQPSYILLRLIPFVGKLVRSVVWDNVYVEERLEVRGRDTCVPAPITICDVCLAQLGKPPMGVYLMLAVLFLVVAAAVGYFDWLIGSAIGIVGLILLYLVRRFVIGRWQRSLKDLLRKIPVYRQMLQAFPWATVVFASRPAQKPYMTNRLDN